MGKVLKMSPGPSTRHQQILLRLTKAMLNLGLSEQCEIFLSPFDVRLYTTDEDGQKTESVVQPDICLVCDHSKLDDKGCKGPPDLMTEIISPSAVNRDLKIKYDLYEKAGVPEYWVVDTQARWIRVFYRNEKGVFVKKKEYVQEGIVKSVTIPGFEIAVEDLFPPTLLAEPEMEYGEEEGLL